jgi:hypothetical protein
MLPRAPELKLNKKIMWKKNDLILLQNWKKEKRQIS